MTDPAGQRRTAFVLSGGGAKTAAHLGAARALAEHGISPVHYVGTSIGSVLAVALAAGLAPDEVVARLDRLAHTGLRPRPLAAIAGLHVNGLLRPEPLRAAMAALLPVRRFSECPTPVTVTAVDMDTGEPVVFGAGGEDVPVLEACMASAALPLYLPPVTIGGRRLGDGGLLAVVPLAEAVLLGPDRIIAVHVGPRMDAVAAAPDRSPPGVRAHSEATGIMMAALTAMQVRAWRADPGRPALTLVQPEMDRNGTFRVDLIPKFVAEGYRATVASLQQP